MSQYAGELFVKVRPDSKGFAAETRKGLQNETRQVEQQTGAYRANTKAVSDNEKAVVSLGSKFRVARGLTIGGLAGIATAGFAARNAILGVSDAVAQGNSEFASLGAAVGSILRLDPVGLFHAMRSETRFSSDEIQQWTQELVKGGSEARALQARTDALAASAKLAGAGFDGAADDLKKFAASAAQAALAINANRVGGRLQQLTNQDLRAQLSGGGGDQTRIEVAKGREQFLQDEISQTKTGTALYNQLLAELVQTSKARKSLEQEQRDQIRESREEAARLRSEALQAQLSTQQVALQIQAANARSSGEEISALQAQADFARKEAADKRLDLQQRQQFALQAATTEKQIFEINRQAAAERQRAAEEERARLKAEREQAAAERRAARERTFTNAEARLQLRAQRSELTKSTADDKAAQKALIRFYAQAAAGARRAGALGRALDLESQKVAAQLALKGIDSDSSTQGLTAQQFFDEAASQFRSYGSNIAGRNGILSGQDARAALGAIGLSQRNSTRATTGGGQFGRISGEISGAVTRVGGAQLAAATRTNLLLGNILSQLKGAGSRSTSGATTRRRGGVAIRNARDSVVSD